MLVVQLVEKMVLGLVEMTALKLVDLLEERKVGCLVE
jgi:hypothetical protein